MRSQELSTARVQYADSRRGSSNSKRSRPVDLTTVQAGTTPPNLARKVLSNSTSAVKAANSTRFPKPPEPSPTTSIGSSSSTISYTTDISCSSSSSISSMNSINCSSPSTGINLSQLFPDAADGLLEETTKGRWYSVLLSAFGTRDITDPLAYALLVWACCASYGVFFDQGNPEHVAAAVPMARTVGTTEQFHVFWSPHLKVVVSLFLSVPCF